MFAHGRRPLLLRRFPAYEARSINQSISQSYILSSPKLLQGPQRKEQFKGKNGVGAME